MTDKKCEWADEFEDEGPECSCGDPDLWESACIDDLCHGGEVPCMHGDFAKLPCPYCSGEIVIREKEDGR